MCDHLSSQLKWLHQVETNNREKVKYSQFKRSQNTNTRQTINRRQIIDFTIICSFSSCSIISNAKVWTLQSIYQPNHYYEVKITRFTQSYYQNITLIKMYRSYKPLSIHKHRSVLTC